MKIFNTHILLYCLKMRQINYITKWREGVGIEPTKRQSTAPPIGFEARDAHQSHIPPTKRSILTKLK